MRIIGAFTVVILRFLIMQGFANQPERNFSNYREIVQNINVDSLCHRCLSADVNNLRESYGHTIDSLFFRTKRDYELSRTVPLPYVKFLFAKNHAISLIRANQIGEAFELVNNDYYKIQEEKDHFFAMYDLSSLYTQIRAYGKAVELLLSCRQYFQEIDQPELVYFASDLLVYNFYQNMEYEKVIRYGSRLVDNFIYNSSSSKPNEFDKMNLYNMIGHAYFKTGDLNNAILYYNLAEALAEKNRNHLWISLIRGNKAEVMVKQGLFEKAYEFAKSDYSSSISHGYRVSAAKALSVMAESMLRLDMLDSAEVCLKHSSLIFEEDKTEVPHTYYEIKAEIEFKKGNYPAYKSLIEKSHKIKDSIFKASQIQSSDLAEANYQLLKMRDNYQMVEQDRKHERQILNLSIVGGSLFFLVSLIIAANHTRIRKQKRQIGSQLNFINSSVGELEQKNLELAIANEKINILNAQLSTQLDNKSFEVELTSKQLSTLAVQIIGKNEVLENIKTSLREILKSKENQATISKELRSMISTINTSEHLEKDWIELQTNIERVHIGYFDTLTTKYPNLNRNDLKLCGLLKLNLSNKHIAEILHISMASLKVARHRLRKKLQLKTTDSLNEFLLSINKPTGEETHETRDS